ncbi:hypothetical protein BS47DRAFT_531815 [Hydnum rufescens UP504]|uniref:Fungal-type protein kinase domain-containing protein n=1 Tax=Hydnum rufescens UP504 TaxID=1448309 RepID=A0A9P6B4A3_9AGAM|nr:hypothetical protein BS47DRAFT_531815 [Hydnum rufescens UP504]
MTASDNTGARIQNGKLFTVNSILEARAAPGGVGTATDIAPSRSGIKRPAFSVGNVPNIERSSAEGTLRTGQLLKEHRVHYRIVFEEIGTPVHKLRTFCDIFLTLRDAVVALKAMFSVQLIHRDVSCTNILLVRAPGERARGLLVDLEYAKDITIKTVPHEFRTGTRDFMAVEVRESAYLFKKGLSDARSLFDVGGSHLFNIIVYMI